MDTVTIKLKQDEHEIELPAAILRRPDGSVQAKVWPQSAVSKIRDAHRKRTVEFNHPTIPFPRR